MKRAGKVCGDSQDLKSPGLFFLLSSVLKQFDPRFGSSKEAQWQHAKRGLIRKRKWRLKHSTRSCKRKEYRDKKDNFNTMYCLLFLYLKIGYKGEGEVIENILKSKNNTEVGSLWPHHRQVGLLPHHRQVVFSLPISDSFGGYE